MRLLLCQLILSYGSMGDAAHHGRGTLQSVYIAEVCWAVLIARWIAEHMHAYFLSTGSQDRQSLGL